MIPLPAVHTRAAVVLVLGAVCLASPASVSAHARLVRSEPANEEVLPSPPTVIRLWFNENLDRGFHSIEVFAASELKGKKRTNLVSGPPEVNPSDRTELRAVVSGLTVGRYVVEYRVLSRDGHTAPGRLTFEVRAP